MRLVVVVKYDIGQDFAKKKVTAALGIDQHGILADEAYARLLSMAALQDRAGIDVDAVGDLLFAHVAKPVRQRFESGGQRLVVIQAPGIGGDSATARIVENIGRYAQCVV